MDEEAHIGFMGFEMLYFENEDDVTFSKSKKKNLLGDLSSSDEVASLESTEMSIRDHIQGLRFIQ